MSHVILPRRLVHPWDTGPRPWTSPRFWTTGSEKVPVGAADCLVTGDRDLLDMSPFQDIPILTPAGFLDFRTTR